jgi:hypothetical protein
VPELQGEPEEISKEKARLAAVQVISFHFLYNDIILAIMMLLVEGAALQLFETTQN